MKDNFDLKENGAVLVHSKKKHLDIFNQILICLLLVVCTSVFWFCISHSLKIVEGGSMQPTINKTYVKHKNYDIVLFNKFQKAGYGDVVIVDFEEFDAQHPQVIKRLIAKEGDKLNITWDDENQKLVVNLNGKVLDEPYTIKDENDKTKDNKASKECYDKFKNNKTSWNVQINEDGSITIPKGHIFVLGDNRTSSEDSSKVGPLEYSKILGVVDTLVADGTFLNSLIKFLFSLN